MSVWAFAVVTGDTLCTARATCPREVACFCVGPHLVHLSDGAL